MTQSANNYYTISVSDYLYVANVCSAVPILSC